MAKHPHKGRIGRSALLIWCVPPAPSFQHHNRLVVDPFLYCLNIKIILVFGRLMNFAVKRFRRCFSDNIKLAANKVYSSFIEFEELLLRSVYFEVVSVDSTLGFVPHRQPTSDQRINVCWGDAGTPTSKLLPVVRANLREFAAIHPSSAIVFSMRSAYARLLGFVPHHQPTSDQRINVG